MMVFGSLSALPQEGAKVITMNQQMLQKVLVNLKVFHDIISSLWVK
jgi:hypothetical protein